MFRSGSRRWRPAVFVCLAVFSTILVAGVVQAQTATAGQFVISEFRYRGPNGANDEFIEIQNLSGATHTVTALSGTGYGVVASDGFTRCSIPNGTIIPDRGKYLCVNTVGYSLASYPSGTSTATGNSTYTTNIPENAGIAIFNNNSGGASYSLANRLDAVGTTAVADTLYKEGTGLPTLVGFSIDYAWVRDQCGKGGSITTFGPCPTNGATKDTNNNAADFVFVDTNGTSAGGGQRLGAPGPQNLAAPIFNDAPIVADSLDTCVDQTTAPNFVRDLTSVPAQNSTFGTIDVRYTFTNNTGAPLTRLRFRVVDLTTFPAPSGIADLRPRTSIAFPGVTVDRPPCGGTTSNVTVEGTTLEQPPAQPNGGGFNSSLSVTAVSALTPLAPGATIDVRFLFGVQQTGAFKFALLPEALPEGGAAPVYLQGCTNDVCPALDPFVTSITRANPNPTSAGLVDFNVSFSEPVTGVDAADFALTTTGSIAGASVTNVAGSGDTWTVTVDTGTGTGTIRLDVVDNDSIVDADTRPLGSPGAGNGNYTFGEVYTIVDAALVPPTVVAIDRADPDPTAAASINWTVRFNEPVTGVDAGDFALSTTGTIAGAAITNVTGSGDTYTVTASTGTGDGTIGLNVVDNDSIIDANNNPLGGPGAGNGNFTGEVYTVIKAPSVVSVVVTGPNPTDLPTATFTVTFSENVTGVDLTDFALTTTIPGASITNVAGAGAVYTVTVNTGAGGGTIRLDVIDNDSIEDADSNPLGGPGAGNGNFTTGTVLTVSAPVPIPTIDPRLLAMLAAMLAFAAVAVLRR